MLGSKNSTNPQNPLRNPFFCWWFQTFLMSTYFTPPGEMIQFDEHIFQLGGALDPKSGHQKKGSFLKKCGGIPSGTDD